MDFTDNEEQPNTAAANDGHPIAPRARVPTPEDFQILYDQEMTDEEIAKHCGVPPLAIVALRKRLGLPPNTQRSMARQRMFSAEFQDPDRVRYEQPLSGTEIGQQDPSSPVNRGETTMDICMSYWSRGMTDPEIAAVTKVSEEAVREWRARYGLSENSPARRSDSRRAGRGTADNTATPDLRSYVDLGWNDTEIATTRADLEAVERWRKNHRLPGQ